MSKTPFIITVDTEGDDIWSRPHEITTRNASFLPRFQSLCERFGFKPVYLANYEMAMSEAFVEFALKRVVANCAIRQRIIGVFESVGRPFHILAKVK